MKPNKDLPIGSILQIVPGEDTGHRLRFLVIKRVYSWGVTGYIEGVEGSTSRSWNMVEPTGGKVVFDRDGKPFAPPVERPRHHP